MRHHDIRHEAGRLQIGQRIKHFLGAAAFQVETAGKRVGGGDVRVGNRVFEQSHSRQRASGLGADRGNLDVRVARQCAREMQVLRREIVVYEKNFLHGAPMLDTRPSAADDIAPAGGMTLT